MSGKLGNDVAVLMGSKSDLEIMKLRTSLSICQARILTPWGLMPTQATAATLSPEISSTIQNSFFEFRPAVRLVEEGQGLRHGWSPFGGTSAAGDSGGVSKGDSPDPAAHGALAAGAVPSAQRQSRREKRGRSLRARTPSG